MSNPTTYTSMMRSLVDDEGYTRQEARAYIAHWHPELLPARQTYKHRAAADARRVSRLHGPALRTSALLAASLESER